MLWEVATGEVVGLQQRGIQRAQGCQSSLLLGRAGQAAVATSQLLLQERLQGWGCQGHEPQTAREELAPMHIGSRVPKASGVGYLTPSTMLQIAQL